MAFRNLVACLLATRSAALGLRPQRARLQGLRSTSAGLRSLRGQRRSLLGNACPEGVRGLFAGVRAKAIRRLLGLLGLAVRKHRGEHLRRRDELREKHLVYVSDKDRTWRRTTGRGGPPRRERRSGAFDRDSGSLGLGRVFPRGSDA